eukprot:CAMPEP_0198332246 /NCGR_PEP_ID=MMETSP1450-20131203/18146_1 /TAXON_ID=753684 ORGANISM="Madagascaria erythrocladiodes, Strain CCMP3234" /NCGR_SAMPLE_ID=MMETSP1450 /ASSEMBLY_ACC=CAM_ASM_001115 /LENGTH=171 /DNA_ID=CAMNT_0044036687 /DNA_START=105 /DNA_END=616 /DNA_ORIENTATION=-
MSDKEVKQVITPHLVFDDTREAIKWYERAFKATDVQLMPLDDDPKGRLIHASFKVYGGTVFAADAFPEWDEGTKTVQQHGKHSPCDLYIQLDKPEDVDEACKVAVDAGGKLAMPVDDQFWGDRYGGVKDPFGFTWSFAATIDAERTKKAADEWKKFRQQMAAGGGGAAGGG